MELHIEAHPEYYVQALVWAFKREDSEEDPQDMRAPVGYESNLAGRAYRLLEGLARLPSRGDGVTESLASVLAWIEQVRTRASELSRLKSADRCLGRLLGTERAEDEGIWPGAFAREAIEKIRTEEVASGAVTGELNTRGLVARGRGGDQERELATRYKQWASKLRYSHPFVASEVLEVLSADYERMAAREDDQTQVLERVRH